MSEPDTRDALFRRIKTLSERLWEDHCQAPDIEDWLGNFDGRHCADLSLERLHALHLLSSVSYFGLRELRVLLKAMFRDYYRYPIVQALRPQLADSRDAVAMARLFQDELRATRFLGMGNPAESGTHLLYYFRQENRLSRSLFVHQHELLTSGVTDPDVDFAEPNVKRIVFIDDVCGSGEQSVRYSTTLLRDLKAIAQRRGRHVEFHYLVLFGTTTGLKRATRESDFDYVAAVSEIDETYKTFGAKSRVFRKPPAGIDKATAETLARGYGGELSARWPVGYEDGQLLIGFHHNVPANSLPILWWDEGEPPWIAAFRRRPKFD
jgi:hypothetical protein